MQRSEKPVADGNGSLDHSILGACLLLGDVPEAYRRRLRPDLFVPELQRTAEAMLAVAARLGACPSEPLKEEMAARGAGVREIFALGSLFKAGALPDELPDLVDALEQRAVRKAAAEAPVPVQLSAALDALLVAVKAGPPKCVPTPFPTLNRLLCGGFAPGELVYVGAYPGVGKSVLALELARHAAKAGERVLIFSLEMVNLALARRMLAQEARVRATALKTGRIGEGEWVLLEGALQRLRGLPIWLTDQARSLLHIEAITRTFPPPLGLVIVDYLQLVTAAEASEDRRLQVDAISQSLKALAVALSLPVIAISSLTWQGDQREPTLGSLKESRGLSFDGDIILFLHRKDDEAETSCRVAKNRDGETGKVALQFRAQYTAFEEVETRGE